MKTIIIILLFFSYLKSEKDIYHSTPNRIVDILHSVIDIKIDLFSESVIGKVTHTFTPLGSSVSNLDLDAEDMVVRRVRLDGKDIPFFRVKKNYIWILLGLLIGLIR